MKRILSFLLLSASLAFGQGLTWPPSAGTSVLMPFGQAYFPGLVPVAIYSTNLSTGDHSLRTVPSGKKSFAVIECHNASGVGNVIVQPTVSLDGGSTWLQVSAPTTINNGSSSIIAWESFVFAAAEQIGINTATNNGLNCVGASYEFDAISPVRTVHITGLSNGNNTLYTCCGSGTKAFGFYRFGANFTTGVIRAFSTGSNATTWNYVQSGGSVATTNRIFNSTISANNTDGPISAFVMSAGDFINVAPTTGATITIAYTTVLEF